MALPIDANSGSRNAVPVSPDYNIDFTFLGAEDIRWGFGVFTVERFGEEIDLTEVNGAHVPYDATRSVTQKIDELIAEIPTINADMVLSIGNDTEQRIAEIVAISQVDYYALASYDADKWYIIVGA